MTCEKRYIALFCTWILFLASFCMAAEEIWIEVTSPNFIVISNAPAKQAQNTAKSFEQFRLLIKGALPKLSVDPGTPLTVFTGKDEKTLNALLAEERREKGATKKAGIFVQGPERSFVALSIETPGDQRYHVIYHEYVHMLMRLNLGEIPLWLAEGLAEFFGYATLLDGTSHLGTPGPESLYILKTQPMIPLTTLFSVTHDSPYYREQEKTGIFYAQSWVLVHYLMFGDKQAHAKQLGEYVMLLRQGVSEQEAATRSFGDLKALDNSIHNYVDSLAFYSFRIPTQLDVDKDPYKVRTLSPAESLASRGEFLVYLNKPDPAQAMLDQSLQMDPRNARANEAIGHLFVTRQNWEQAQKHFLIAAESDSQSYLAQFYAGQSLMKLDGAENMTSAENHLRKAILINPKFAPAYRLHSHILQKQAKFSEALEAAQKAVSLEPGVLSHSLNVAAIMVSLGKMEEAEVRAKQILALARTDQDRIQAESFMNSIRSFREQQQFNQRQMERPVLESRRTQEQMDPRIRERQELAKKQEEEKYRAYEETEKKRKAEAELRARLKTGPPGKFLGIIQSVQCEYPATMEVVIKSKDKERKLYAENYYKVQYGAIGKSPRADFNPCDELGGKKVEIEFLSVVDQNLSGLIQSIVIME
jgi:tetratricopeptide (TPR) repeat protein